MDKWSETQQKRCGTYERNLRIERLSRGAFTQVAIGKLFNISRQRVCQILQELEKAQEKSDREWDTARDGYGGEAKYE